MDLNSPLFDRIRIKPSCDEPRREEKPACEHAGCGKFGEYRAPKGRGQEGRYWRFCLDHVREYNKGYNYFAGMADDDVQAYQKDASTGHRPTWSSASNSASSRRRKDGAPPPASDFDYLDPFGVLRSAQPFHARRAAEPERPRRPAPVMRALEALGLDENADSATIKSQYKTLVKRFHPDAHGGDRSLEDRLREIIRAHDTLKAAGLC